MAEVDPRLASLMDPGHQRLWDKREARQARLRQGSGSGGNQRLPVDATEAVQDGQEEALVDVLLRTPGLEAKMMPSHLEFLQQVQILFVYRILMLPQ